jgi:HPt (histidine-containing phosphotransfer) domain-containing protein
VKKAGEAKHRSQPPASFTPIEGVDTARGLAMLGGSAEAYREVLALYCKDAAARLDILREPPAAADASFFVTQAHALKSASANIGAMSVSALAARLEDAGQRGDMAVLRAELGNFSEELQALLEGIRAALPPEDEDGEGQDPLPLAAMLSLKAALLAEKIGEADAILAGLQSQRLGAGTKKALRAVSEHILMCEFNEAVAVIENAIRGIERL